MTAEQWLNGANSKVISSQHILCGLTLIIHFKVEKVSLDPKKQKAAVALTVKETTTKTQECGPPAAVTKQEPKPTTAPVDKAVSDVPKAINIVRSSKFRHIEGKFKHRSTFISKIPSLSSTVPGDSNAFQVTFLTCWCVSNIIIGRICI